MSDLEKVNPNEQMDLVEIASHTPKYVDEKNRSFKTITLDEWYEIVQWLQLRMDDASKWTMTKIIMIVMVLYLNNNLYEKFTYLSINFNFF